MSAIPTLSAIIRPAVKALQDLDMHREVQLILSGGIRNRARMWPRRWRWARMRFQYRVGGAGRAWATTTRRWRRSTTRLERTAGAYDDWHEGLDPGGNQYPGSRP